MKEHNLLEDLNKEDIGYFFKGLRYSLGISLVEVNKFDLDTGLFGNWECGLCKPNFENLLKIQELIKESGKTKDELIQLGKLNIYKVIEEISELSGIPLNILIRFVLSNCTSISGLAYLEKIKARKVSLSPKNKKFLLNLLNIVKENRNENPRKILLLMQNHMLSEEQFSKALKYEEIIGFQARNNKFENEVYSIINKFGEQTVKNALLSDENFNYITEVDLCTKINGKTIVLLCKDTNKRKFINIKWDLIKKVENINNFIKPDFIVLVSSCDIQNKMIFSQNNTVLISLKELDLLKDSEYLCSISRKLKSQIDNNKTITTGKDIKVVLKNKNLSAYQLAKLINMDGGYITRVIREDRKLTSKLKNKLNDLLSTKLNNRDLHSKVNLELTLNQNNFMIKYIREKLGFKIKDLAKIIGERPENLDHVERGLRKIDKISEKIIKYLQKFTDFNKYKNEAILEYKKLNTLIKARKFRYLIGIRSEPKRGNFLERNMCKELIKRKIKVIKNGVISDEEVKFKKEVDLYAIKNDEEIVIECSMAKIPINLKDKAVLFNEYKKLGVKKVIYINPELTNYAKNILNKAGIIALKPEEFGEYLDGN